MGRGYWFIQRTYDITSARRNNKQTECNVVYFSVVFDEAVCDVRLLISFFFLESLHLLRNQIPTSQSFFPIQFFLHFIYEIIFKSLRLMWMSAASTARERETIASFIVAQSSRGCGPNRVSLAHVNFHFTFNQFRFKVVEFLNKFESSEKHKTAFTALHRIDRPTKMRIVKNEKNAINCIRVIWCRDLSSSADMSWRAYSLRITVFPCRLRADTEFPQKMIDSTNP